ncbi:arsenite methyltransferase [Candidatus Riflebacteria bacterium]
MSEVKNEKIRQTVRETYARVAQAGCGCDCACDPTSAATPEDISKGLGYSNEDVSTVPHGANMGLGCGNPQAIASLKVGETVLDLGSGGGFDCFLAARAVGENGYVIGVDMTDAMLDKARKNAEKTGLTNVEFRKGEIENLPVDDNLVDVIISNCVVNLSPEKPEVFKDAFRVLRSGGRLAITDVVATAPLPEKVKKDMALYTGCISGASPIDELKEILEKTGFTQIQIKPIDKSREIIKQWKPDKNIEDYIVSATIEAVKP